MAKANTKRKPGRPSEYTPELGAAICGRIANNETLRSICSDKTMPAASTVALWVVNDTGKFSDHYARARQAQATILADEIIEIADDSSRDFIETEDGPVLDREHIQRSRLRVDTRKWYLSKVLPKVYGEKVEVTGKDGGPIEHRSDLTHLSAGELKSLKVLLAKASNGAKPTNRLEPSRN
jgi:hypothetical protein